MEPDGREQPEASTPAEVSPAAQPVPPRAVLPALTYAQPGYDRARDLSSLDREMTARLCNTFGACLLAVGTLLFVVLCPMACQSGFGRQSDALASVLVPVLGFIAPGALLRSAVEPIRLARHSAPSVVLVGGLWLALVIGAALLVLIRSAMSDPTWGTISSSAGGAGLQALIFLALFGANGKLLYHDIRLMAAPGHGPTRDAIVDVGAMLTGRSGGGSLESADLELLVGVRRLAVIRAATGSVVTLLMVTALGLGLARARVSGNFLVAAIFLLAASASSVVLSVRLFREGLADLKRARRRVDWLTFTSTIGLAACAWLVIVAMWEDPSVRRLVWDPAALIVALFALAVSVWNGWWAPSVIRRRLAAAAASTAAAAPDPVSTLDGGSGGT